MLVENIILICQFVNVVWIYERCLALEDMKVLHVLTIITIVQISIYRQ